MAKRKTKQERERDKLISDSFRIFGNRAQINIFDIPRIFQAGRHALENGLDLDAAIQNAIATLRQN
jgi:hypothetical protein